jgi:lipopolysaccharide export system protein LptC
MLNSRFVIFALLLAALALWFSFEQTRQPAGIQDSSLKTSGYSWQLFNSTTWQYDKQDEHRLTITQSKSVFYQDNNKQADFEAPKVMVIEPQQTLTLHSVKGQSFDDNRFELNGQVDIRQFNRPFNDIETNHPDKTLKSEHIAYDVRQQLLSSDGDVTITHQQGVTSGTGLMADLKTRHIQLLSNVRGDYNPTNSNVGK